MARRKFRSGQRHEPATDRSFPEYSYNVPAPQTSRDELLRLVRGGEDTYLELKVKLSNPDRIAQAIVALANTGGGTIVFGVNDNLRVEGVDDAEEVRDELVRLCREQVYPALVPYIDLVSFDSGRRVVAIDVEGRRRPYQTADGRYFIRVGADKREATREELSELLAEARPLRFENVTLRGVSDADIDEGLLWAFVREFEGDAYDANSTTRDYPTGDVLKRELLLAAGNMDEVLPTVAGLLLFGRDERVAEFLPQSRVVVVRYAGDAAQAAEVERAELRGNLHTLYESATRFISRYCDLHDARPRAARHKQHEAGGGAPAAADARAAAPSAAAQADAEQAAAVVARSNYSRAAVAEALSNALAHRDLALREKVTRVNVFDRSIEIVNPRRTAGFAPPAQRAIRYGIPQRLNPQLASVFGSPAYGLKLPTGGLPALLRSARTFAGRRPDINIVNDEFRLRLHGI